MDDTVHAGKMTAEDRDSTPSTGLACNAFFTLSSIDDRPVLFSHQVGLPLPYPVFVTTPIIIKYLLMQAEPARNTMSKCKTQNTKDLSPIGPSF